MCGKAGSSDAWRRRNVDGLCRPQHHGNRRLLRFGSCKSDKAASVRAADKAGPPLATRLFVVFGAPQRTLCSGDVLGGGRGVNSVLGHVGRKKVFVCADGCCQTSDAPQIL
jgi:hypothetical protein